MKKKPQRNRGMGTAAERHLFGVLANQARLDILRLLQKGEMNVTQIVRQLKLGQTLVSHHLKTLTTSKLVKAKRDGYFRVYSLNGVGIAPLLEFIDGRSNKSGIDYRAIFDQLPAMVWLTGQDGSTIEFCNKFWTEYTGLTLTQGISAGGWIQALHADDRKRVRGQGKMANGDGKWSEISVRFRRNDGTYHRHVVRLSPLHNGHGEAAKWIGIAIPTDGSDGPGKKD